MSALSNIEHFVVLMLENRSFDSMLGTLYPKSPTFDGLAGTEQNADPAGAPIAVWCGTGTDEASMRVPDPDPGELWTDINTQLFGTPAVPSPAPPPTMDGFVKNYLTQKGGPVGKNIMHYYTPKQVPVLSTLAKKFAVCDRWFASAPCQTWPNRWFVHAATADGHQDNEPIHLPDVDTIYNRFERAGMHDWTIYFHDMAQAHTLLRLLPLCSHFHPYSRFAADCQTASLPTYSFIEPQYYPDLFHSENDQHPPSVVTLGEQLIADVYNCLRASKLWTKTLLIITYDEHGGCYDHVPPPAAAPPAPPTPKQVFAFDRYGVRVPTVIVSPYVQAGTTLRPPGAVPFDHTSIIATLRKRYPQLGGPLTARDAAAPDLESVLTLTSPDNKGPSRIRALPYAPTPATAATAHVQPLNSNQQALTDLAANLPQTPGVDLQACMASLKGSIAQAPDAMKADARTASAYVKQQVGNFFRSV
ncbi:MAG TPA: alkaline phosphatase family protein [Xanthobacteraceae bacterium]|nr:alkaline phosphatase family protein [Xanthobacteraceae bacterium]